MVSSSLHSLGGTLGSYAETPGYRSFAKSIGRAAAESVSDFDCGGKPADGPIDVVDLFCGCGGLSIGFEHLGRLLPSYRLAGAADFNEHCVASYSANLPIAPKLVDLANSEAISRPAQERDSS
jgi:hypothetical protein